MHTRHCKFLFASVAVAARVFAQAVAPAPASTTSSSGREIVTLEEFKVTDQRDEYKGNTAITGTKTDVPLLDVPAPITVITKDVIDDFGGVDITDLYPLMAGVTDFSYGGASIRGFRMNAPDPTRYNGIAGSPYNDFGVSALNNIEQIEILKGPVGLLYGDNEAGGMINIVTAKPKSTFGGAVNLRLGSFNLRRAEAQVTGPIDSKKRFLYLVNAAYTDRDSFRNNYHQRALNLNGALTWVIGPATRLTGEIEDITDKQKGARQRGIPFIATDAAGKLLPAGTSGGHFVAPPSFSPTEPTDFQNLFTTVYNARLDHAFTNGLRFNTFYRHFHNNARQKYHEGNLLLADLHTEQREFRHQLRVNSETSWGANLIGDYQFLAAKHKILAGTEYYKVNRVFTSVTIAQTRVPAIDVLNPIYGRSYSELYPISLVGVAPNDTDKIRHGYFLQDQLTIGEKWHALIGARYEKFDDLRRSPTSDQFSDDVLTYRGGLVYKIQPNVAAYYSYAMGLKPQTLGSEDQHGPFPPQKSTSHEAGFKADIFKNRLSVTTSVYQIVKTNILEKDPTVGVPSNWLAPIGEVTSKGVDFDVSGQINRQWNIIGSYAYNDAKITKTRVASQPVGSRFPNAARHKAGLWTRYTLPSQPLGFGFGFSHISERPYYPGISAQDFPGPAYTIYSAAIYYRWKRDARSASNRDAVSFSLKCDNLTDKVYSKSVLGGEGQFPGTPRNFTFTTIYRF